MSHEAREIITWIIATAIGLSTLIGIAVRFALLPYLRDHLVQPLRQVEKQVSENAHANDAPTVLDRIDDVQQAVDETQRAVDETRIDVKIMRDAFKGHTDWSQEWVSTIEGEISSLKKDRRRWWK